MIELSWTKSLLISYISITRDWITIKVCTLSFIPYLSHSLNDHLPLWSQVTSSSSMPPNRNERKIRNESTTLSWLIELIYKLSLIDGDVSLPARQLQYSPLLWRWIWFVDNANRAAQAQSKIKILEKLPELEPPEADDVVKFKLVEYRFGGVLVLNTVFHADSSRLRRFHPRYYNYRTSRSPTRRTNWFWQG